MSHRRVICVRACGLEQSQGKPAQIVANVFNTYEAMYERQGGERLWSARVLIEYYLLQNGLRKCTNLTYISDSMIDHYKLGIVDERDILNEFRLKFK